MEQTKKKIHNSRVEILEDSDNISNLVFIVYFKL